MAVVATLAPRAPDPAPAAGASSSAGGGGSDFADMLSAVGTDGRSPSDDAASEEATASTDQDVPDGDATLVALAQAAAATSGAPGAVGPGGTPAPPSLPKRPVGPAATPLAAASTAGVRVSWRSLPSSLTIAAHPAGKPDDGAAAAAAPVLPNAIATALNTASAAIQPPPVLPAQTLPPMQASAAVAAGSGSGPSATITGAGGAAATTGPTPASAGPVTPEAASVDASAPVLTLLAPAARAAPTRSNAAAIPPVRAQAPLPAGAAAAPTSRGSIEQDVSQASAGLTVAASPGTAMPATVLAPSAAPARSGVAAVAPARGEASPPIAAATAASSGSAGQGGSAASGSEAGPGSGAHGTPAPASHAAPGAIEATAAVTTVAPPGASATQQVTQLLATLGLGDPDATDDATPADGLPTPAAQSTTAAGTPAASAAGGVVTLELSPRDLGHVTVTLRLRNAALDVHIVADNKDTAAALSRDRSQIEAVIGATTGTVDIAFAATPAGETAAETSAGGPGSGGAAAGGAAAQGGGRSGDRGQTPYPEIEQHGNRTAAPSTAATRREGSLYL